MCNYQEHHLFPVPKCDGKLPDPVAHWSLKFDPHLVLSSFRHGLPMPWTSWHGSESEFLIICQVEMPMTFLVGSWTICQLPLPRFGMTMGYPSRRMSVDGLLAALRLPSLSFLVGLIPSFDRTSLGYLGHVHTVCRNLSSDNANCSPLS